MIYTVTLEVLQAGEELRARGLELVLISRGKDGLLGLLGRVRIERL